MTIFKMVFEKYFKIIIIWNLEFGYLDDVSVLRCDAYDYPLSIIHIYILLQTFRNRVYIE